MSHLSIHPVVDSGVKNVNKNSGSTKLSCRCTTDKVELTITEPFAHNHLCGCTACWKPASALFSQVAVVPKGSVRVTHNEEKMAVINKDASIKRFACAACGTHMVGRVTDVDHHYYGLEFVHPELAAIPGLAKVEFAAYVSSLIESGVDPEQMSEIRERLKVLDLEAYDTLSPELMDVIAYHQRKIASSR